MSFVPFTLDVFFLGHERFVLSIEGLLDTRIGSALCYILTWFSMVAHLNFPQSISLGEDLSPDLSGDFRKWLRSALVSQS